VVTFGPFQLEEWVQGSHLRLIPNPYYGTYNPMVKDKGPVKIDALTLRFIPDSFTRVQELVAGDVDIAFDVPGERVESLKKNPDIQLDERFQLGADIIYLQPDAKGLTDVRVRHGIARAIDRKELVTALSGFAEERYGILAPAMIGFSQEFEDEAAKDYSYDPAAAAKLFDEAGYVAGNDGVRAKDGEKLEFTLLVPFDVPTLKIMAPVLQSQLKKAGVNLNIREFEDQYVKQTAKDRKNEVSLRHYIWPDGDMLTWIAHSDSGYFSYPDIDELIVEGRKSADPAVRAKAYAAAEREIMNRGLVIPLVTNIEYTAFRKNIKNLIFLPTYFIINNVVKE
jgi:peptide/nickel transport system substrate-binding protein